MESAFVDLLRAHMGPLGGEPLVAALGYVEFLFRYKSFVLVADSSDRDKMVRATLEKILVVEER